MKKILALGSLFLLLQVFVLGMNEGSGSQGNRSDTIITVNTEGNQNQGEDQQLRDQVREELGNQQDEQNGTRSRNTTELRQRIQERKQEMKEELELMSGKKQKVYKNQNLVRETVHNLLEMRYLLDQKGGIGQNISEIAREFNNSVQSTIIAEEKIQTRSRFMRILVGGDDKSADELQGEVSRNNERIQRLKQLKEQIQNDDELRQVLQEQIQQMEQEQSRLQELSQNEKKNKGLFGWLFKK